jgi:hypothetical protein
MRRWPSIAGAVILMSLSCAAPSFAQQSINFFIGGFAPRGENARPDDDVLVNDLNDGEFSLAFRVRDFSSATVGAEYLTALGEFFDVGLGVSFYGKTVPSVYENFINENGDEIEQDLRLRIVPFTATFRFLPLGHSDAIKPYVGGGVGIFAWRYTETGDFVDSNRDIFSAKYEGSGTATGPVILGGLQIPLHGWDLGGEVRYQRATGDLPSDVDFLGSTIDLGGWSGLFTVNVHF